MADQKWETMEFATAELAVQFLNEHGQGPGEGSATLRHDGTAGLIYLAPGSLGTSTSQTWIHKELPGPDGTAAAVQLLNDAPGQGPGEASASMRGGGSVGLIFLAPGSQGTSTSQAWYFQPEPAPDGTQLAVQFLNEGDKQGPGEASVTTRGDGTAGIIFLGPGSLGASTEPTWYTREFDGPNGAQDAVDFLNAWPQQPGPGEAVAWLPGSGAVIFYLAGPTGIVHP
jgi:hypothetical protein